jgi:hypothetical protein
MADSSGEERDEKLCVLRIESASWYAQVLYDSFTRCGDSATDVAVPTFAICVSVDDIKRTQLC